MPRKMNIVDRTLSPIGELRCPSCNKLLIKEMGPGRYSLETKCPRCGDVTLYIRKMNIRHTS